MQKVAGFTVTSKDAGVSDEAEARYFEVTGKSYRDKQWLFLEAEMCGKIILSLRKAGVSFPITISEEDGTYQGIGESSE